MGMKGMTVIFTNLKADLQEDYILYTLLESKESWKAREFMNQNKNFLFFKKLCPPTLMPAFFFTN
jgi:hypothetical protein